MKHIIAVCIEREAGPEEERFIRCTARSGREAGLAIGLDGSILWCSKKNVACDLWVTDDNRLVAVLATPNDTVRVERGRRGLDMPLGRAVVILDQDVILVENRRFRVHVHGATDTVHPPQPLRIARGMAVVAAMTVAMGCGDGESPTEANFVTHTGGTTSYNSANPLGTGGTSLGLVTGGSSSTLTVNNGIDTAGSAGTAGNAGNAGNGGAIEIVDFPPILQ